MRKISFLLLGTSLSLVPQTLNAAECAVTDCSLLGYTDSACPGSGLKCPFGDGWYCGGGAAEDCIKLGYDKDCTGAGESGSGETCNGKYQSCTCDSSYQYTCSGTGYAGGSGTACGGKYTSCTCSSPYTWSNGTCKCPSTYQYPCTGTNQTGGSGYNCGGKYTACSCSSGYEWKNGNCQKINPCANKSNGAYNEIYCCNGTVVGVKGNDMDFYVAMTDLGQMNWYKAYSTCSSYRFCNNLKGSLPGRTNLLTLYRNKSQVNTLLSANDGTQLVNGYYWSSQHDSGTYDFYYIDMSNGKEYRYYHGYDHYVRPVLTSW